MIAIGVTLALMIAGVPVVFAMLIGSLGWYVLAADASPLVLLQRMQAMLQSFPLLAVPFFLLAGTAMSRGGIAQRLIAVADALVGHWRGGLAQVNVMNSVLIGGMSGSCNADAAIDAKVLVPVMVRRGFGLGFSTAVTAASSVITPILPPSIGLVIYGLIANTSIGALFLGGIIPGFLIAAALMLTVAWLTRRRGYGPTRPHRARVREIARAFRDGLWALLMPVLLLLGLRLGFMTMTELAAFAAVYALFVGVVIYREIPLAELAALFREATHLTAAVMLIVSAAAALGWIVTAERIPQQMVAWLSGLAIGPVGLLLAVNGALLILGMFVESTSLLILVTPILVPVAVAIGIDPVHLGLVLVINLTIGTITPPVGSVMYTACAITGCSFLDYTREILPFVAALLCVLLLVTLAPELVLVLPRLAGP